VALVATDGDHQVSVLLILRKELFEGVWHLEELLGVCNATLEKTWLNQKLLLGPRGLN
jgi:hypothetical protein